MKNLIFICGTTGVGKSATCQELKTLLPHCIFFDGDQCRDTSPLIATEEAKYTALDNITHLLNNFIACSAYENIIFCRTMHEQTIIDNILSHLHTEQCNVRIFSLVCSESTLRQRLEKDIACGKRTSDVLEKSLVRLSCYAKLAAQTIDTSALSIAQTAALLCAMCSLNDEHTQKNTHFTLRKYRPSDCAQIIALFYDTVHTVNAKDYSPAQIDAWTSGAVDFARWNQTLCAHNSLVALRDNIIVGFGDLDGDYLDRLYVHKDYQRIGVATALADALECTAVHSGAAALTTHASITAKPFFEARGYRTVKKQQVERKGILLTNFVMKKDLP